MREGPRAKVLNLLVVNEDPRAAQATVNEVLACADPRVTECLTCECSIDRGISFVRDRVMPLARQTCLGNEVRAVVFYDAHLLTYEAQSALRRCIENQQSTSRFVLVTPRPRELMEPIRSRLLTVHATKRAAGKLDLEPRLRQMIGRAISGSVSLAHAFKWSDRCVASGVCALDVLQRAAARRKGVDWETMLSLNEMVCGCCNERLATAVCLHRINRTLNECRENLPLD